MQGLFFSQRIARFSKSFLLAAAIAFLAGCSSGGTSSSSSTPPPPTGTAVAATIQVSVSLPQILSTSTSTSDVTAVVLDASGQAVSGKVVTFSSGNDPTAYYTKLVATTDANGVATATLNIGSNQTNRTITVTVAADQAKGTTPVVVTGTTIIISGNTSLALNASTTLTASVKNSAGVAVPGVALTMTSANGNTIGNKSGTPAGTSDANGQVTFSVTAKSATTPDTITVTGGGATQTQALAITATSSSFAFTAPITIVPPATTPEILVNTATPVSVLWTNIAGPVVGSLVNFYATRGALSGGDTTASTDLTDGTGTATVNILSAYTGSSTISANGPGNTPSALLNVVFVTNTAATITAQASPNTIGVNASGTTTNQSVISVVVRDAALNLVKNANVAFNLTSDPSNGTLSSPVAVTDISGTASVNYIAGGSATAVNQVLITATVDSVGTNVLVSPISTTTTLSVGSQPYFVRLQTDNTVAGGGPSSSQYTKSYYALVTDSLGHAVPNAQLNFTLRPVTPSAPSFFKGSYTKGLNTWVQSISQSCASEDSNSNGIRDLLPTDEDLNGNNQLDPYGVAVVNATAVTDATGYATAAITYNKGYANWVRLVLEARTQVTGNDPPSLVTVDLPGAAIDYSDTNVAPPGFISPWGSSVNCNDIK